MPSSPLVGAKLHVPRMRHGLVVRPRLDDQLGWRSHPRLTLVSAPAGFGKTTLLTAWLASRSSVERPLAWVSLDEGERELDSYWAYVVAALDRAAPGVGTTALALLDAPGSPIRAVVATVLNGLAALPVGLDLVLDDYHLADSPAVAGEMTFLLEHLPPDVHVVISTRADPALPLARLRARGELVEIRAADLRFTLAEVTAYLNDVAGLDLRDDDLAALEARTEGWIAALQLAALSLRQRDDASGFIAALTGDDRYVVDYLVEEVLTRQSDDIRTFLLRTSVLDRLGGALCDEVAQRTGSGRMLELLDRSNLFVVALDDHREWYRYHHLFRDVLRAHLLKERPDEVAELHRRASLWYDAEQDPVAAVRHALAAGDVEHVADLVERAIPGMLRDRREAAARRWLEVIPDHVVAVRPVLAVGFIGALMSSGEFGDVERRLDDLERLLADAEVDPSVDLVAVDEAELARLPGVLEMYRAGLALVGGDLTGVGVHADRAMGRAADGDDLTVSAASALSGLASWTGGDLPDAHRRYSVAVEGLRRAGHFADVLGCSITLADIRITQGRLADARRTYDDALQLATAHQAGGTVMRGTADMLVGLSRVAFERNELQVAEEHLSRAEELGEHLGLPQHPYRRRVARARLREAAGDIGGALALLDEAQRVYVGDFSPDVRPIAAMRARLLAAHGRGEEAEQWARGAGLSAEDVLSYLHEYEHLVLARVLLRQEPVAALGLLDRVLVAAEDGGRTGTVIEALVLQAVALHRQRPRPDVLGALVPLERALVLAEPERSVRVFVGEGAAMAALLEAVLRHDGSSAFARSILDAMADRAQATPVSAALVDQLSPREVDVLRLLATDLDGPQIARRLVVSLNTVRTHTKSIYAKLGVRSRRTAVTRARELDLLPHPHRR
jgi:LuxR family maltose regulon positive regulatory protein